jgi:hypothetical protein
VLAALTLRASHFRLLVHHDALVMLAAIVANVFVNWHEVCGFGRTEAVLILAKAAHGARVSRRLVGMKAGVAGGMGCAGLHGSRKVIKNAA